MYPNIIKNLIEQLMTLPSIGPKTAERLALFLASKPKIKIDTFIKALHNTKELKVCQLCNNFSDVNPCPICNNSHRQKEIICVVANASDLEVIESTGKFNGIYHILGGLIDPLAGMTPDKLFIKELVNRIKNNNVKEIILAFDANIQGEATTTYLKNIIVKINEQIDKRTNINSNAPSSAKAMEGYPPNTRGRITISRLARGIPMGSDLEYTDELTLSSALENRKKLD